MTIALYGVPIWLLKFHDFLFLGAKLKGSFSRYDFQRNPQSGPSAVKSYKTILPAAAKDVYYRDEIGNISTSHLRDDDDYVELELRPRYLSKMHL